MKYFFKWLIIYIIINNIGNESIEISDSNFNLLEFDKEQNYKHFYYKNKNHNFFYHFKLENSKPKKAKLIVKCYRLDDTRKNKLSCFDVNYNSDTIEKIYLLKEDKINNDYEIINIYNDINFFNNNLQFKIYFLKIYKSKKVDLIYLNENNKEIKILDPNDFFYTLYRFRKNIDFNNQIYDKITFYNNYLNEYFYSYTKDPYSEMFFIFKINNNKNIIESFKIFKINKYKIDYMNYNNKLFIKYSNRTENDNIKKELFKTRMIILSKYKIIELINNNKDLFINLDNFYQFNFFNRIIFMEFNKFKKKNYFSLNNSLNVKYIEYYDYNFLKNSINNVWFFKLTYNNENLFMLFSYKNVKIEVYIFGNKTEIVFNKFNDNKYDKYFYKMNNYKCCEIKLYDEFLFIYDKNKIIYINIYKKIINQKEKINTKIKNKIKFNFWEFNKSLSDKNKMSIQKDYDYFIIDINYTFSYSLNEKFNEEILIINNKSFLNYNIFDNETTKFINYLSINNIKIKGYKLFFPFFLIYSEKKIYIYDLKYKFEKSLIINVANHCEEFILLTVRDINSKVLCFYMDYIDILVYSNNKLIYNESKIIFDYILKFYIYVKLNLPNSYEIIENIKELNFKENNKNNKENLLGNIISIKGLDDYILVYTDLYIVIYKNDGFVLKLLKKIAMKKKLKKLIHVIKNKYLKKSFFSYFEFYFILITDDKDFFDVKKSVIYIFKINNFDKVSLTKYSFKVKNEKKNNNANDSDISEILFNYNDTNILNFIKYFDRLKTIYVIKKNKYRENLVLYINNKFWKINILEDKSNSDFLKSSTKSPIEIINNTNCGSNFKNCKHIILKFNEMIDHFKIDGIDQHNFNNYYKFKYLLQYEKNISIYNNLDMIYNLNYYINNTKLKIKTNNIFNMKLITLNKNIGNNISEYNNYIYYIYTDFIFLIERISYKFVKLIIIKIKGKEQEKFDEFDFKSKLFHVQKYKNGYLILYFNYDDQIFLKYLSIQNGKLNLIELNEDEDKSKSKNQTENNKINLSYLDYNYIFYLIDNYLYFYIKNHKNYIIIFEIKIDFNELKFTLKSAKLKNKNNNLGFTIKFLKYENIYYKLIIYNNSNKIDCYLLNNENQIINFSNISLNQKVNKIILYENKLYLVHSLTNVKVYNIEYQLKIEFIKSNYYNINFNIEYQIENKPNIINLNLKFKKIDEQDKNYLIIGIIVISFIFFIFFTFLTLASYKYYSDKNLFIY